MTVAELFERSAESLQLFTDGEKRYSRNRSGGQNLII
jgi:hypothetical protein